MMFPVSRILAIVIGFVFLIIGAHASPLPAVQEIYQFSNGTWIENIAVRSCGKLLVTLISAPEVWEVDPSTRSAHLIYQLPNTTSALGIAEVEPDVFAVIVDSLTSDTREGIPGTFSVWAVDFAKRNPEIEKVADIPEAGSLNGATALSALGPSTVLLGDGLYGLIWQLDIDTSNYQVWADDPAFDPSPTGPISLGINGIRSDGSNIYFTNIFASPALGRIPVSKDGFPAGPVQTVLGTQLASYVRDDFAFDCHGNIYLATHGSNSLLRITPDGGVTVVAGGIDDPLIAGATSAAFGRTNKDSDVLYVTTDGATVNTAAGREGGKIVAFDTKSF